MHEMVLACHPKSSNVHAQLATASITVRTAVDRAAVSTISDVVVPARMVAASAALGCRYLGHCNAIWHSLLLPQ